MYVGSARLVAIGVGNTDGETECRESGELTDGESKGDAQ